MGCVSLLLIDRRRFHGRTPFAGSTVTGERMDDLVPMAISSDTDKWDYYSTGKPGVSGLSTGKHRVLGLSTGNPGVLGFSADYDRQ